MRYFNKIALLLALGSFGLTAAAQNVSGHITCDGKGVAGVAVSDGYVVTKTDANGAYSFTSAKKNGYVFYTLPGGYEPTVADGFKPEFWAPLTSTSKSVKETHDFTLKKVDNDKFTFVVSADYHLANRTNDDTQFKSRFMKRMKELKESAQGPVYSTILGDLTWDLYWAQRNYNLNNFMATMKEAGYPFIMFPVIGNHDNDASVAASTTTDFDAAKPWRNIVSPNYYSYNLGQVHFVVLDDIYYLNTKKSGASYPNGVVGERNYLAEITSEQFDWLKKDLAMVDKNTPVVVSFHIPAWKLSTKDYSTAQNLQLQHTKKLSDLLAGYKTVHFLSGHTHYNQVARPAAYPNIVEHNIAAVCASWWWTGKLTNRDVCTDGSPGGYSLWQIDGKDFKWKYMSSTDNVGTQMRLYDMNKVRAYYQENADVRAMLAANTSRQDYKNYDDNVVMANVYAYDSDWKIEFIENGTSLSYKRETCEDPYHVICYDVPRFKQAKSYTSVFATDKNTHMFRAKCATSNQPVTVKVTDSFGTVYIKTLNRPAAFNLDMENYQRQTLGVDDVVTDLNNSYTVHTAGSTLVIDAAKAGTAQLVSLNGMSRPLKLSEGRNEFSVNAKGIYVVSIEGRGYKVAF